MLTVLSFGLHSNITTDQMLYTEKDLEKSMDKIETINFHQVGATPPLYITLRASPFRSVPFRDRRWT